VAEDVSNAELSRSLVRIESKLDRETDDHELRIRRVERYVYVALGLATAGAASGIGTLISAIGG